MQNKNNGISVLVIVKNDLSNINQLLQSFLKINTYKQVEFIIVSNNSDSNLFEVISKYAQEVFIRLVVYNEQYSFAEFNNIASKKARFSHLLFLSDNIEYTYDVLFTIDSVLADSSIGIVGVHLEEELEKGLLKQESETDQNSIVFNWDSIEEFYCAIETNYKGTNKNKKGVYCPAVQSAFLFCRKADFKKLGGFCEQYYNGFEYIDFCLSMTKKLKKKCYCITEISLKYRNLGFNGENNSKIAKKRLESDNEIFQHRVGNFLKSITRDASGNYTILFESGVGKKSNPVFSEANSLPLKNKHDKYKLLFVTTVFNRVHHLKKTLPMNLDSVRGFDNVGLLVVDFGGDDSPEILQFIEKNFAFDIMSGKLNFFQAKKSWSKFYVATAKNIAHRLIDSEFLFFVGADNIIYSEDVHKILDIFDKNPDTVIHQTTDIAPMRHQMWKKYKLFSDNEGYHSFDQKWNGPCGRIGVSKKCFESINGYNENFISMGMDDIDFLIRSIYKRGSYTYLPITRSLDTIFIEHGVTTGTEKKHAENLGNLAKIKNGFLDSKAVSSYSPRDTIDNFKIYIPCCVENSKLARVTLFSNVFHGKAFKNRLFCDITDILDSVADVNIWLLDIKPSNSQTFSKHLKDFSKKNSRVNYVPVEQDPGLYEIWNICLRNIASLYVGNLKIDDLRGEQWLPICLDTLDQGACDVASPSVLSFSDANVESYNRAIMECEISEQEPWFKQRVMIDGDVLSYQPLKNGEYTNEDLIQVLPSDEIESYCIPNASSIWKKELHNNLGYFNEDLNGFYADLAFWMAASENGFTFQQIDYHVLFFISEKQVHRKQKKNIKRLLALTLQYGTYHCRNYAKKRLFDLKRVGGSYGIHHAIGWDWVRDEVNNFFIHTEGSMLLDMFVERTFFWNPIKEEQYRYTYQNDWVGFVHTTPHTSKVFENESANLDSLFAEQRFIDSLKCCKGLIVLSQNAIGHVKERLKLLSLDVPVFSLFLPNLSFNKANLPLEKCNVKKDDNIYHVGWHLRSFSEFARLKVDQSRKILLIPKGVEYFVKEVVNKDLKLSGLRGIKNYVAKIYSAPNDEYKNILEHGIIFNNYIEPSGSNLISECIAAGTALVINRHPAFEEYLGCDYPLFYDNRKEAEELIEKLKNYSFRDSVRQHLGKRRSLFSIEQFCKQLEKIAIKIYLKSSSVNKREL